MSFDLLLLAGQGKENHFDRAIAERAFESNANDTSSDWWNFHMSDGKSCAGELSIDQTPKINGFAVHGPPNLPWFWDALFEVLRQTRTFLVWPAPGPGPSYCVANEDWKSYIGEELTGDMGEPVLVRSGAEIPAALDASGA